MKVFIIQNKYDFNILQPHFSENCVFCSSGPGGTYELEKAKKKYFTSESFFDETKSYKLGIENFIIADKICRYVHNSLCKNVKTYETYFEDSEIILSLNYSIRNILDYIIKNSIICKNLLSEYPEAIFAFSMPWKNYGTWKEFFTPHNSFYNLGFYLNCFLESEKKENFYYQNESEKSKKISFLFSIKSFLKRNILRKSSPHSSGLNYCGFNIPIEIRKVFQSELNGFYNYEITYGNNDSKMFELKSPLYYSIIETINKELSDFNSLIQLNHFFKYEYPLGLEKEFSTFINCVIKFLLPELLTYHLITEDYFKAIKPKAVILISPSRPKEKIILSIAKKMGIERINLQHGGAWGYYGQGMAEVFHSDLTNIDIFVCYGNGVKRFLESNYKIYINKLPKIMVSGSIEIDRISQLNNYKKNDLGEIKKILYVPTSFNIRRLLWHYYPEQYYYYMQKTIVDYLSRKEGIEIGYKEHYKGHIDNPLVEYIIDSKSSNIIILKGKLEQYLEQYDSYLIDSPTTTLLQVIATKKPVFVFVNKDLIGIDNYAFEILSKRAEIFYNLPELFLSLNEALKNGYKNVNKLSNTEFLELYGVYYQDGKSKERLLEIMQNI